MSEDRTATRHSEASFFVHNPVEVHVGRNRVGELPGMVPRPVLVVTTPGSIERIDFSWLFGGLRDVHIVAAKGLVHPPAVDAAAALGRSIRAQSIIGLGGGSAIDTAKCVSLLLESEFTVASLRDLLAQGHSVPRSVPLIAVPTTAGSGSEVTPWASVWESGRKWSIDTSNAFPDIAVVDPHLTDSLGARVTASGGLDAFAHAVEAVWGASANPFSDALAVSALFRLKTALIPAITRPTRWLRDSLAVAALLAGQALSCTRSATAHALSYPLTGLFGLEHGLAVGLMCRALLEDYNTCCPERIGLILRALSVSSIDDIECFIDDVFLAAGLRPSLSSFGIPQEHVPEICEHALSADRMRNSVISFSAENLQRVLNRVA